MREKNPFSFLFFSSLLRTLRRDGEFSSGNGDRQIETSAHRFYRLLSHRMQEKLSFQKEAEKYDENFTSRDRCSGRGEHSWERDRYFEIFWEEILLIANSIVFEIFEHISNILEHLVWNVLKRLIQRHILLWVILNICIECMPRYWWRYILE